MSQPHHTAPQPCPHPHSRPIGMFITLSSLAICFAIGLSSTMYASSESTKQDEPATQPSEKQKPAAKSEPGQPAKTGTNSAKPETKGAASAASATDGAGTKAAAAALPTLAEARGQARLLHDAMHTTLQVVHRRFYREDEGLPLPAGTFKTVFRRLAKQQNVKLRWLAVDGRAMDVDHEPQNAFEKAAVRALSGGAERYERVENNVYRHAGAITLLSQCLKCHVPNRTNTDPHTAGLIISMPIKGK